MMELTKPAPLAEPLWGQRFLIALVGGAVAVVTVLHYLTSAHLLEYHTVYRSLYYLPVAGAAVAFGLRGGLLTAAAVILLYLPHVLGMGETLPGGMVDNLLELPVFLVVGGLVGALADRERAQRRRVEGLRAYIDAVMQSLPVGVATAPPGGQPIPQNPVARELLPAVAADIALPSIHPGYHVLEQGQRPLGLHVSRLRGVAPEGAERVYVLEDLTEQRALEAQLRRNDRLASVGQLAAGMAHEVRNPLAILRATAQLLANQLAEQQGVGAYARVLIAESDRIDRLISELLEYARPRPPHRIALDLPRVLAKAAHHVRPYALQHEVSIEVRAPAAGELWADGEQLRQALVNVLLNAVQASPPGSVVQLTATVAPDAVALTVTDHGRGMPLEVRERACDPFFTTRPDGTGLGLALVATIVQEHGGALHIDSLVGNGTTVTLALPRETPDGPRPDR
jgi:signal transduction histidine kinase